MTSDQTVNQRRRLNDLLTQTKPYTDHTDFLMLVFVRCRLDSVNFNNLVILICIPLARQETFKKSKDRDIDENSENSERGSTANPLTSMYMIFAQNTYKNNSNSFFIIKVVHKINNVVIRKQWFQSLLNKRCKNPRLQSTEQQMALEVERYSPPGRSRAGRKAMTL